MIDITKEQLIPIRQVPAYLEKRGFGRRVHVAAVYRWVHHGLNGVRLESVRIGGTAVTSAEAIQRWAAAREQHRQRRYTAPAAPKLAEVARRREETHRRLQEYRVMPTELDGVIRSLTAGEASAREHVASVLFRAGMRTLAHAQARSVDHLLGIRGIGPQSAPVVRALAERCAGHTGEDA